MEALVFALIAFRNGYKEEESFVPEPDDFQPFDLRALAQVYNATNDSSNRRLTGLLLLRLRSHLKLPTYELTE